MDPAPDTDPAPEPDGDPKPADDPADDPAPDADTDPKEGEAIGKANARIPGNWKLKSSLNSYWLPAMFPAQGTVYEFISLPVQQPSNCRPTQKRCRSKRAIPLAR